MSVQRVYYSQCNVTAVSLRGGMAIRPEINNDVGKTRKQWKGRTPSDKTKPMLTLVRSRGVRGARGASFLLSVRNLCISENTGLETEYRGLPPVTSLTREPEFPLLKRADPLGAADGSLSELGVA